MSKKCKCVEEIKENKFEPYDGRVVKEDYTFIYFFLFFMLFLLIILIFI